VEDVGVRVDGDFRVRVSGLLDVTWGRRKSKARGLLLAVLVAAGL